jgi:hypothetical protein
MLKESIPEIIKNVLLVLASQQILSEGDLIWEKTWTMLEPSLPQIKQEIFAITPKREHKDGLVVELGEIEKEENDVDGEAEENDVDGEAEELDLSSML